LFKGDFPDDGVYKLFIEAQDVSNNESGSNDYSISFEVINKPSITHVMNWPNPFTTATHFVFTLTGSEIPTYFKIQIMTITGKVVREIDLSELGIIHIGRNITDYAWNGTDEFGDRLANGVYLYRVITRLNENKIELKQTQADQYFKKEFGKMYLMGN
jgi:flagellar hook assembly protein FlgD